MNDTELSKQRRDFEEAISQGEMEELTYDDIKKYACEATISLLENYESQEVQLGGLHFMCIAHVLSPRQWPEAEALSAGVHQAIMRTRQRVAMTHVSPIVTGDNNTLRLTNRDLINVKLVKGFIMYLRSWGTTTNDAKRDAQTEETIQQIINTGVTGEARTSSQQPAPHLRSWGQKVQCSLIAVTQLTRELTLDPEVSVSERLMTIIGAGTVTECSNACCQALLNMIKSVDTVARLAHSPVLAERTEEYDSSPTNLQQFWSKDILSRIDEIVEKGDPVIPGDTIDVLRGNITTEVRECYKGTRINKIKRTEASEARAQRQWVRVYEWLTGGATNADISMLISHHYSVLRHQSMGTKVKHVIKLAKKILGIDLACAKVQGNGLCYANTALTALHADTGGPVLGAIAGSIATLLAEANAWEDNALPDVFDLVNKQVGKGMIYILHQEGGQEMQDLEDQMKDANSKLRQCLYVVIQNPLGSEDPFYVGKTHFTVLTRDWRQHVGQLCTIVRSYNATPTMLACQQRAAWTCMDATRAFMTGKVITTPTAEQLTEEEAMRAFNRMFDACGALKNCHVTNVPYHVLEDIAHFIGIDVCMLITTESDDMLHGCMKAQVRAAMDTEVGNDDWTTPIVYDEDRGLTSVDVLAKVPHRQPYIPDISTSKDNGEGLTQYRMAYMIVITETGHIVMVSTPSEMPVTESTICCYKITDGTSGTLRNARINFTSEVQRVNCKVVIIQTDSRHGSVLAETLYNGVGTSEDEAQNNNTTPRLAGGPPTASSARQSNVSYASLEESNKHAKNRCVHHINILRERESVTGIKVPTEVYSEMHYTEECVSPDNPYLACTKFPGGMDAVIKIHAIQDDEIRKIEWMRAMSVMRQIMEQRTQTTNVVEEVHNSADAEDAGTREVSDSVCDLNGESIGLSIELGSETRRASRIQQRGTTQ